MAATKKSSNTKKPPTKSEILNHIAEDTDLTRKQVSAVLESLEGLIAKELKPRGAGMFNVPGLMKIKLFSIKCSHLKFGKTLMGLSLFLF